MKRKLLQTLPLFGMLGLIIVFGIIAFSLTPADAVMEEPTDSLPASAKAPTNEEVDTISVTATAPEDTNQNINTTLVAPTPVETTAQPDVTMVVVVVVGMILLTSAAITLIYKRKR